jgi:O-antigen biosynthesis protein
MSSTPHICFIGYVWPEAISSAAGIRTEALVAACQSAGWRVSFLSPSKLNNFSDALKARGIYTESIPANDDHFNEVIRGLDPDFVLFDRFVIEEQFAWRVRAECPEALHITDTQDLHFLRRARMDSWKKDKNLEKIFSGQVDLATEDSLREIAAIYRSDLNLIISSYEMKLLEQEFAVPAQQLLYSPLSYPAVSTKSPSYPDRKDFVFLGNFRHPPNYDSIFWLAESIWPEIRKELPTAELHIYGAYPPKEVADLETRMEGVKFYGPMPDQYATLAKYRVNLAPLRFGAGIKGKIADGWQVGTPVVTTPIGAEGMGEEESKWGGIIVRTPENFVSAAVLLYRDQEKWEAAHNNGIAIVKKYFNFTANSQSFIAALLDYKERLPLLRRQNLIGRMLWQNQFQATKYMSRWITLKNKIGQ